MCGPDAVECGGAMFFCAAGDVNVAIGTHMWDAHVFAATTCLGVAAL